MVAFTRYILRHYFWCAVRYKWKNVTFFCKEFTDFDSYNKRESNLHIHMKFLEKVRKEIRRRNYSYSTEKRYSDWIKQFIRFHDMKHPNQLQEKDIVRFLNHLVQTRNVAASTQNQALCAIIFVYKQVLKSDIGKLNDLKRAKKPKHLPTVLSKNEVKNLLEFLDGVLFLVASLLYGTGLRISEALRLRVQDIDFDYMQITVRSGHGVKSPLDG